jgi:hypothetical protein
VSKASITADHLDIEPADAVLSDAALDALAALLVDFALADDPESETT